MSGTAARLVDRVVPNVRFRQWVVSVPFELRLLLASRADALTAVGRIAVEEILRWQRQQARARNLNAKKTRGVAPALRRQSQPQRSLSHRRPRRHLHQGRGG